MEPRHILLSVAAAVIASAAATSAHAATTVRVGSSGKTYASSTVQCRTQPATGMMAPMVQAGLFNPKPSASAVVTLNGALVKNVVAADPVADVWLIDGNNSVVVALSRKSADTYSYVVAAGQCNLPDISNNTFSADGTLEYAASGKSYATVTPGCALNPSTGQPQPYVNLFDNGGFLLNVSVNGVALTQLSAQRPHTPVFLSAGVNVISATNGTLSTDYYVRDGGDGTCVLP
jgi:hypothetical protein